VSPLRPTSFHAMVLLVGAAVASYAWSKEKMPHSAQETNVTVWTGRPTDVQRIGYQGKDKKLELELREEKKGERWFYGKVEYAIPTPTPAGADGGATPASKRTVVFASVLQAKKVTEGLVPLKAIRALGKIPDSRAAEFGLEKRDVTVTIALAGKERTLIVGSTAPGGTDTYVLDPTTNEAYVIKSEPVRDLESGEGRLMEREQHGFKEIDVRAAKVTASGKTREIVRSGPEGKKFWADPADKEKPDETAGNWLSKVDRLRVSEYAASPPEGRTTVVRVDYSGAPGHLGFFEMAKVALASGQKPDYWILTEHSHLWGKVFQATGEQIEQDVGSVVR
jgi:hypothetical protein